MQTYSVHAPAETHFVDATCEDVGCDAHAYGWKTIVDTATDRGAGQAFYIRNDRTRSHTEERREDGMTVFLFKPGQRCFTKHRRRTARPEIFVVRDGDWRGNPTGRVQRMRTGEWLDRFGNHMENLRKTIERG
jgi:hypothetical protein